MMMTFSGKLGELYTIFGGIIAQATHLDLDDLLEEMKTVEDADVSLVVTEDHLKLTIEADL